ncbi:MAG: SDR family oxidoreductase [Betaproteobacteria bacterium]
MNLSSRFTLKRNGRLAAKSVLYLASADSRFVTGQVLPVDGGVTI